MIASTSEVGMAETGPPIRVLVVDNEPEVIEFMRFTLEPAGYEVLDALSGPAALEMVGEGHELPDIIILDVELGGMNGFEVCGILKADPRTRTIPIIILTGKGKSDEHISRGLAAGANEYLIKPIDVDHMRLRVRNTVELPRMFRALNNSYRLLAQSQEEQAQLRGHLIHDLKTPLTSIQGFTDTLIQTGAEDPKLLGECLKVISEESQRLVDDIDDILKPLDSHWSPKYEDFDLSSLLDLVVQRERITKRASGRSITCTGIDRPLRMSGDRRKIRRVLENLLSNAVKYSPGEGKAIRVDVQLCNNEVKISVTDTGIGMTDSQLQIVLRSGGRVVDPKLKIEGIGLGIPSCQQILEAHGGRLEASSSIGCGSTFHAILPIERPDGLSIHSVIAGDPP